MRTGMRIIPVIDLQDGRVVRGIGGRRHEYRPIVSCLTSSCRPADVACAFRDHFGLTEVYVADLDAIAGGPPALPVFAELRSLGFHLWVDAGIRCVDQAVALAAAGAASIVLGLETIAGPGVLREACSVLGSERVVFSLDLKDGVPLADASTWGERDAWSITTRAISDGIGRLMVLDLARVGLSSGIGTEELCARLAAAYPHVELAAGGGVRGVRDLERLETCGVGAAIVASALHDGRLRREDLPPLQKENEAHTRHS